MHADKLQISRMKIAQLWHLHRDKCRHNNIYTQEQVINNIVRDNFDVNCKDTVIASSSDLIDYTALHVMYYDRFDAQHIKILLDRGADFTMKNANGQTVVHMVISDYHRYMTRLQEDRGFPFMDSVLSAHVKFQNFANPQDNNGVSHLHAACILNRVDSLKFFLDNGASVDQAVNADSPIFPGFTPLHFAAKFGNFEASQMLISHGANVQAKDAKGSTLLDLCVEYRLEKLTKLADSSVSDIEKTDMQAKLHENERLIKLLMEKNCPRTVEISTFQLACTLEDLTIAESLVDQVDVNLAVPMESPVCPGYTAAHFAALNDIRALKMLLARGAKFDTDDGIGSLRLLDICLKKHSIQEIRDALSSAEHQQKRIGAVELLDVALLARDVHQFKLFLRNTSATQQRSLRWANNCALLHVVVMFSANSKVLVEECLRRGLDVNAQDSKGQTAIHLAFRLRKRDIVELLLRHLDGLDEAEVTNLVDEDNLSYLHIACATSNQSVVEKLLRNSDPNVVYKGKRLLIDDNCLFPFFIESGSTPLHLAASASQYSTEQIARMLLSRGANLHATDAHGWTPIHCLLRCYDSLSVVWLFMDSLLDDTKDCVVPGLGLSHLHVACTYGHAAAAERLLDAGSNVNAAIDYERESIFSKQLSVYEMNRTPLQCATSKLWFEEETESLVVLLLRCGADLFDYYSSPAITPLCRKFDRVVMSVLWNNADMQKRAEEQWRLTRLHIACYLKNEEAIRSILLNGDGGAIDVNGQVHADCLPFAGCTPIHLLFADIDSFQNPNLLVSESTMNVLLDRGADLTILNNSKNTPIHALYKFERHLANGKRYMSLLLKALGDVNVNPVNAEGFSHFHLACLFHEEELVEKFLKNGVVDVNRSTGFYAQENPGCTPLHLALSRVADGDWTTLIRIVDLLLKHGAEVAAAEDVHGDTPLHEPAALHSPGMIVFEKLVSCGADMKRENVTGLTPLVKLSNENPDGYARVRQNYNCRADYWNRVTGEGYIGKELISQNGIVAGNVEFQAILQSTDLQTVDELGRSAIHNAVAAIEPVYERLDDYIYAIRCIMKRGIDIDHQDNSGRTALHYAAKMANLPGAEALLTCGADIDIVDSTGQSAFSYALAHVRSGDTLIGELSVAIGLYLHVQKLMYFVMDVSQLNRNLARECQQRLDREDDEAFEFDYEASELSDKFFNQIERSKSVDIGVRSLTLFNFLSDTSAVSLYPHLSASDQRVIDDFFKSRDFDGLRQLRGVIKLQYAKMKRRLAMLDSALYSLRVLLGFSVPGLCEEITRFLRNSDLKSLIAATTIED